MKFYERVIGKVEYGKNYQGIDGYYLYGRTTSGLPINGWSPIRGNDTISERKITIKKGEGRNGKSFDIYLVKNLRGDKIKVENDKFYLKKNLMRYAKRKTRVCTNQSVEKYFYELDIYVVEAGDSYPADRKPVSGAYDKEVECLQELPDNLTGHPPAGMVVPP